MGQGSNIQDTNQQPRRWAHEGTNAKGREVQVVKEEIPTRIDCVSDSLVYLGFADWGMPENESFWKIREIRKLGTVWSEKYAFDDWNGGNEFFRFKWSDRYILTYV